MLESVNESHCTLTLTNVRQRTFSRERSSKFQYLPRSILKFVISKPLVEQNTRGYTSYICMIRIRSQGSPIVKGSRFQLDTYSPLSTLICARQRFVCIYVCTYVCTYVQKAYLHDAVSAFFRSQRFVQLLITDRVFQLASFNTSILISKLFDCLSSSF